MKMFRETIEFSSKNGQVYEDGEGQVIGIGKYLVKDRSGYGNCIVKFSKQ